MMATVNVLNQMAEYDFNAPIDVEMIFEDSDNDDSSFQSTLCEQNINENNNNKQVPAEKSETNTEKDNKTSENQINNKSLNKSMLNLNKNSRILQPSKETSQNNNVQNLNNAKNAEKGKNPNDIEHNQNKSDGSSHGLVVIRDDTINGEQRLPGTRQINDHEEPATFIEDLLNKLSEHLFLIMQSFYHYGVKTPDKDNKKREEVFRFIQSHFFELSYSTVESIFLPQEQNESFINKFIDNTVMIANSKSLRWKCQRHHVLPFFKELMTWTKHKKESIKNNPPPSTSNENILLKQQLVKPLLPLNLPQPEIVANSNIATQKTQSNLCIFSSGPPGKEISINIDANTLNKINERQHLTVKEAEHNRTNNKEAQSCEKTRRKTPIESPTFRNRFKHIQKNNPQYVRPPPPAYHTSYSSRKICYKPQHYNHSHTGQPHQNHPIIRQPIHNYSTQVHHIDTNHTLPPHNNNFNYLYDNRNNNIPMRRTQTENQVMSSPVTSNVPSLDPKTQMLMFRCYMCGKRATAPCNPYNPPCRIYFCSYLCQELDSQYYKPAWGNT